MSSSLFYYNKYNIAKYFSVGPILWFYDFRLRKFRYISFVSKEGACCSIKLQNLKCASKHQLVSINIHVHQEQLCRSFFNSRCFFASGDILLHPGASVSIWLHLPASCSIRQHPEVSWGILLNHTESYCICKHLIISASIFQHQTASCSILGHPAESYWILLHLVTSASILQHQTASCSILRYPAES